MKSISKKILKTIARISVFFRMKSLSREARLSVIQYSMQKLENPFIKL